MARTLKQSSQSRNLIRCTRTYIRRAVRTSAIIVVTIVAVRMMYALESSGGSEVEFDAMIRALKYLQRNDKQGINDEQDCGIE